MLRKLPGVSRLCNKANSIKVSTNTKIQLARDNAIKGSILFVGFGSLIWLSMFIYIVFYYTYIPPVTHSRPIHLQFQTCEDADSLMCSFPLANVHLTRRQQLLMVGQKYMISVELEMPESEPNQNQGMFLVCVELTSSDSSTLGHICKPTMLRYRSALLRWVKLAVYAPFYLFGSAEEKQTITVDLFTDFVDDKTRPVTDAYVELRSRRIQVYSAKLLITAHFSGLRHLMYNWPATSALIGTSIVLCTLLLVFGLSWHQISQGDGMAARASRQIRDRFAALTDETDCEDEAAISDFPGEFCKDVPDDSDGESIERLSGPEMNRNWKD